MEKKLILTDVDGVLVTWLEGFDSLMLSRGHKRIYQNEYNLSKAFGVSEETITKFADEYVISETIANLPPIRGSRESVRYLHEEHGYVFHCITSIGNHPETHRLRLQNLQNLYGKDSIYDLHCVSSNKDKEKILSRYRDSGLTWVEDHAENYQKGLDFGLNSLLIDHEYNRNFKERPGTRFNIWNEIVDRLT